MLILAFVAVGAALLLRLGITALVVVAMLAGAKVDALTIGLSLLMLGYWGYAAFQFAQRRESGRVRAMSLSLLSAIFGGAQLALGWRGLDLGTALQLATVVVSAVSAGVLYLPAVKREMTRV